MAASKLGLAHAANQLTYSQEKKKQNIYRLGVAQTLEVALSYEKSTTTAT